MHEELLAWAKVERARYTSVGGFVLFTAMMAVGSSTVALTIAFRQPWYVVVFPALFWGVLIFNLDRWIVSSSLPERGAYRFVVIWLRLLMAFVFGIVIAEPVVLKVFETAVTEQLAKIRVADEVAYESQLKKCNPSSDQPPLSSEQAAGCQNLTVTDLSAVDTAKTNQQEAQRAADDSATRLAKANTDVEAARGQMNNECRGLDGSPHGNGDVCQLLTGVFNQTQQHRDKVAGEDLAARTALDGANKALSDAKTTVDASREAKIQQKVNERKAERNKEGGLLERIEALNSVAAQHLSLLLATWAIRLLLILIDCAPAIAKFSGGTTYDRLVRAEAQLGEKRHGTRAKRAAEQADSWADESEEHAEIDRARRRHERDRAADALMLSAAQRRRSQAPQFRPIADDGLPPFGRATYTLVSRVEPAGPAAGFVMDPPPVRSRRRDHDGEAEADPRDPGGRLGHSRGALPSISVVALGGPGSGKTTLLAQMYHKLRETAGRPPFTFALADGGPRTHLENWAETIREPGAAWPDSTATTDLVRYEFTCQVAEHGDYRPILKIDYWDYSGEALLQDTDLPGIDRLRHDLSDKIAAADALLVIVDGEDLRRAAAGDAAARQKLAHTLKNIATYAESATCPAQIVVTKWDQLERQPHPRGGEWSRAKLIVELSRLEPIRAIGRGRTYRAGSAFGASGMRVIPVSVVGGFGSTVHEVGRPPFRVRAAAPVNVDVPFAGLLPDRLDQIYASKGTAALERDLRLARSRIRRAAVHTAIAVLGKLALGIVNPPVFVTALAAINLGKWLSPYISDRYRLNPDPDESDLEQLRQARRLRASAAEVDHARRRVLQAFSDRLIAFDRQYPPNEPRQEPGNGFEDRRIV
ncbi:DUF4407 domain-containing protein [Dactylosporangium sp. NPDC049525]|uniref:DUF4407 domain-containing protein n=1 Tax=Dactylosporangium sp. NPDC049525 TaxID=3154730 RepID=UPI00343FCB22